MSDAILLLSGGLDSVVLSKKLLSDGVKFDSLFIDGGKLSTLHELEAARLATIEAGGALHCIDISQLSKSFVGYVSANYVLLDELDRAGDTIITSIGSKKHPPPKPSGFPIILAIATFLAQISGHKSVYCGVLKEQADPIPTTRDFFTTWSNAASQLNGPDFSVKVETPFINYSKTEVVSLGKKLKVDFNRTWSCMYGGPVHCGVCPRCGQRKSAFKKARQKDPTQYSE